jgi:molybdopterin molybdotransferase
MTQLKADCFAFGGPLMTVDAAIALLDARLDCVAGEEAVALADALGRFAAADVLAPRPVPPHANSAVDGYAVFFDDLSPDGPTRLAVAGRLAAGQAAGTVPQRGAALRVFTGAALPPGPDTVVMQEDVELEEGPVVVVPPGLSRGANFRHAGEDVAAGALAIAAGRRLRAQDVGLAASLGLTRIPVRRRLRVGLFSTGDEIVEPGSPASSPLVFDANRFTLAALIGGFGCTVEDLGIVPDRPDAVRRILATAAGRVDVIVSSGGVSTGEEDHVRAAVEAAGGRLDAWRLAIKPGRPVALGQVGGSVFIGLPGNPVAVMVTFLMVARPILLKLAGGRLRPPAGYPVRAGFAWRKKAGRREFLRVHLEPGEDGEPRAIRFPRDGAGILSSLTAADGLAVLPEPTTAVAPGDRVSFIPFEGIL